MTTIAVTQDAEMAAKAVQLHSEGKMLSVKVPQFGSGFLIMLERAKVENSMKLFAGMDEPNRQFSFEGIQKNIRRAAKKYKKNKLSGGEMDELVTDCMLWLAHALAFGDGEKYLVAGPSLEDMKKGMDDLVRKGAQ